MHSSQVAVRRGLSLCKARSQLGLSVGTQGPASRRSEGEVRSGKGSGQELQLMCLAALPIPGTWAIVTKGLKTRAGPDLQAEE